MGFFYLLQNDVFVSYKLAEVTENVLNFLYSNINDITDCCRRVQSFLGQILNPKEGFCDLYRIHRLY